RHHDAAAGLHVGVELGVEEAPVPGAGEVADAEDDDAELADPELRRQRVAVDDLDVEACPGEHRLGERVHLPRHGVAGSRDRLDGAREGAGAARVRRRIAHHAQAVAPDQALHAHGAGRTGASAAVDVGLVAVLYAVRAARRRADPQADLAGTVGVGLA